MLETNSVLVVSLSILLLAVVLVASGVRIVPQGEEWVTERFGRFLRVLHPGISFIIPFFDRVGYKVVTKDIVLDIERQEVITRDNAVISTSAVAFTKVTDSPAAVYGVVSYPQAVCNLVQTSLRAIIGEMELDDALSSRESIKIKLKAMIADDMADWGITLKTVEIQDIQPSTSMQEAMEQQAAAERERKAMIIRAEGAKQASILEAEGRFESAKRDADAEVALADASKKAISLVSDIASTSDMALYYLLGQRYIDSIRKLSDSENSKFVMLPADLKDAVKGIFTTKG